MRFLLAADIGGTNSRFALFKLEEKPEGRQLARLENSQIWLKTAEHGSLAEMLERLRGVRTPGGFTLLGDYAPAILSLAVPGAVSGAGGRATCHAPNIAWPLSAAEAEAVGNAPAALLNDFAAQGLACLFPEILGLREVLPGRARPEAPTVVLGAGTGLGKAIILPAPRWAVRRSGQEEGGGAADRIFLPADAAFHPTKRILPSEGGHSVFPFVGPEEAVFQEFLLRATRRREAVGDMVVSGQGLAALFAFHSGRAALLPPPQVTPRLAEQPRVLEWLARFYGRACRNFVLETLAQGGVYLSGGLLANVPGLLGHPAFVEAFRNSETHAAALAEVPVAWVSNPASGLWGAALHGVSLL